MRRVRIIIALAVLGTLATLALAPPASAAENWVAWRRQFGTTGNEHAFGVAPDSFGNVYCAGYEDPAGAPSRIAVWRFTARGTPVWKRLIGPGQATDCAVDRWGKLYVVGYAGPNVFLRKIGPAGNILIDRRLVATDTGAGGRPAVAIRRDGTRVYVVGGRKCWAWALSSGGSVLASAATTGTSAEDVVLGPGGGLYVVGTSDWTSGVAFPVESFLPGDSYLRRLDATGLATEWTRTIEAWWVHARSITAGGDSLYVAGYYRWISETPLVKPIIRKYDASGTAGWTRSLYSGAPMDGDEFVGDFAVAADPSGIYMSFTELHPPRWGLAGIQTRKYEPIAGSTLWARVFGSNPGPPPARGRADYLGNAATDRYRNLYIAGSTKGSYPPYINRGGRDAVLFKMSK